MEKAIDDVSASGLDAYEYDAYEDEDDTEPLGAFEFLAQENPGEEDCDCAVE